MRAKLKDDIMMKKAEIARKKAKIEELQEKRLHMDMNDVRVIEFTNQMAKINEVELPKLRYDLQLRLEVFAKYEPSPSANGDEQKEIEENEENEDEAVMTEAVMTLLTLDKAASPSPASTEIENENVSDE